MQLDLKGYFSNEACDKSQNFSFEFSMADVEVNGVHPFVSPINVTGSAVSDNGAVKVTATVTYDFLIPCDRCLEDINEKKVSKYIHLLLLSDEETQDDTYIRVKTEQINIEELLREDIILDLPIVFLCKPDCLGLCPSCGKNLNLGPCECKNDNIDPRLEILKTLLDNK
jgi:uncharacterized protein